MPGGHEEADLCRIHARLFEQFQDFPDGDPQRIALFAARRAATDLQRLRIRRRRDLRINAKGTKHRSD
jgi:hypothetical protein